MPPTRPDCFLFLTTTTPRNPHPLFLISPPFIYSCSPKYRFDHCCPAPMLFLRLFDAKRRRSSKMIVVKNHLVSRRFLGHWMHPTLCSSPASRNATGLGGPWPLHLAVYPPHAMCLLGVCFLARHVPFISSHLFLETSTSASTSP